MLTQLTIQNFGLIDKVSLEFDTKLNILTGETGAGKSIVIDALRIALGERIAASQLRDQAQPCHIEAIFFISDNPLKQDETLKEFWADNEGELIISRSYTSDGKNKIKVNGFAVTVSQLKDIGNLLIDFHGPHDHQMLLAESSHIGLLDRLASAESEIENYQTVYKQYAESKRKLDELQEMAQGRERELDLLSHQIKELSQVPLSEADYDKVLQEKIKVNNAEKLYREVNQILSLLESDESSASECIRQAFSPMRNLNHIDEKTMPLSELLIQIQNVNNELLAELQDYADTLSFEPNEAGEINAKCDVYDEIKRKYGPTLEEAEAFFKKSKERFDALSNFEHTDEELRKEISLLQAKLKQKAQKITLQRQKAAQTLKITIEKELTELGMPKVKFEAKVSASDFNDRGADQVIFYISPNVGEGLKPLAEIVSSGEAARVMLALKKALIKVDPIPVLIFDEIDAQIGGRLGTITGQKLCDISTHRQVILITHLPQIASFADHHYKVTKVVKSGRSFTQLQLLDREERVKELAQMMSGEKESPIALKHAVDMLTQAKR